jgi:tripartite-type tricarboxylate transporter receptor subunit TctC
MIDSREECPMNRLLPAMSRRHGMKLACAAALASLLAMPASAGEYPSRTVTFISAFPAGSGADVLVRHFANAIQESTGHTIIVDNKPGAAGNISAEYVARADPDGYTVYVHSGTSIAMNYHLWNNPPIDPREALKAVAGINNQPFYIVVGADSPHETIEDLVAYLREAGDAASYSTTATSGRVLGAQFIEELGLETVEIPYGTGAEALPDIVSLAVDFGVTDPVNAMIQSREGRFRVLASGGGERLSVAPDIPALSELGIEIDQMGWWGVWVPAGTPDEVVETVSGWFQDVLADDETVSFLQSMGGDVWSAGAGEVGQRMVQSVDQAEYLVELANLPKN